MLATNSLLLSAIAVIALANSPTFVAKRSMLSQVRLPESWAAI